jgi:hypothetical protein
MTDVPRKTYIYSQKQLTHRTTLPLTKEMDTFLKDLSERCKEGDGRHMDKSQIVRALIQVLMNAEKQLDLMGVQDEAELVQRLTRALQKK